MGRPSLAPARRVLRRAVAGRGRTPEPDADETLLLASPLFDAEWYEAVTGRSGPLPELVRHYLGTPVAKRPSPHPLFDRDWFREHHRVDFGDRDVFLAYLRRESWRAQTHPLFDTRAYLRLAPGAKEHPHGPLGHYREVGAAEGLPANDWLVGEEGAPAPDLREWIIARRSEWSERRATVPRATMPRRRLRQRAGEVERHTGAVPQVPDHGVLVSVLLTPGGAADHLVTSLRSLRSQTLTAWRAVVLDDGRIPELERLLDAELPAGSWTTLPVRDETPGGRLNRALAASTGEWVSFLEGGVVWEADRLRLLCLVGQEEREDAMADVLRRVGKDGSSTLVGHGMSRRTVDHRNAVELGRLVVRRSVLDEVGGFDEELPGGWAFDLVARLARRSGVRAVPFQGVTRRVAWAVAARRLPPAERPVLDHAGIKSWADVVLNRSLVDWGALVEREREAGLVSVVVPTYRDWRMTWEAVESVVGAAEHGATRVECLVVDNGCDADASVLLDALGERFEQVRVLHFATNHGFALGNNLALPHVRGEVVVFLNNDTTVDAGWLEPLVQALDDPEVLGAQSLLLYPGGAIQSAGIAFPATGGLPHAFLQGFPAEDAAGIDGLDLHALTGAALAVRTRDVVEAHGFDPVFRNGLEDIDLCLRLGDRRPGRFTVRPDSRVVHHESQTPGRFADFDTNRALFLERWSTRQPRDDAALWASRGFRVVDRALVPRYRRIGPLGVPEPVLVREARLRVDEHAPSLRWAIKNPAPSGPEAERWGDTHFARALAAALRELGQEVVIDNRPEHERLTGRHDDVALVLRGLAPYRPTYENVTIGWVISHPEMLPAPEAASYDRLLAASTGWAAQRSAEWGIAVEPMLQATDHRLFHPDLAVPDTGHPVLFVGGSRQQYRPIVRTAVECGLPLSIYGSQWGPFVPRRYVKAGYLPNASLGAAYRAAGVVLNDHWEDMRVDGFLSNRLFDAAASGARVITDDVAGLGDLFGRSVQVARSPEHLVELSSLPEPDEIFGSDEERREVAARIHREHSFAARAQRLLEVALEARRERGFDR